MGVLAFARKTFFHSYIDDHSREWIGYFDLLAFRCDYRLMLAAFFAAFLVLPILLGWQMAVRLPARQLEHVGSIISWGVLLIIGIYLNLVIGFLYLFGHGGIG